MRSSSKRERRSVARHELIGLDVVVASPHAGWDGLAGRVVDETKNTLLVERPSGLEEVLVPKSGQTFRFLVGGAWIEVRGDDITFRPEDRTKKVRG